MEREIVKEGEEGRMVKCGERERVREVEEGKIDECGERKSGRWWRGKDGEVWRVSK